MLPNTKIVISKNGDHKVESMEQSDQCHKVRDMARSAGKVISEEDKDHTPVYQDVNQKGVV